MPSHTDCLPHASYLAVVSQHRLPVPMNGSTVVTRRASDCSLLVEVSYAHLPCAMHCDLVTGG